MSAPNTHNAPGRSSLRALGTARAAPEFADGTRAQNHERMISANCPMPWEDHEVVEFRVNVSTEVEIMTHRVRPRDTAAPGFLIRLNHQYEQLINSVSTAVTGAIAPILTWRVQVNDDMLQWTFRSSTTDGAKYVERCVRANDVIRIFATVASAGLVSNQVIRLRAEVMIDGDLPYLVPFDQRANTMRTAQATLAAGPVVPALLIGAGGIFAATFANVPIFCLRGTLAIAAVAGSPTIFIHGVTTAGVIDGAVGVGEPLVPGLIPTVLNVDRLDKVALSKPGVGAAVVSCRFALFD